MRTPVPLPLSLLLLLLHCAALAVGAVEEQQELRQLLVVFRHGDRAPLWEPPGYHDWPVSLGQLTSLGIEQMFGRGKAFRDAYVCDSSPSAAEKCVYKVLSSSFVDTDVYVRSSDVDRTLVSAQAFLQGLYPPGSTSNVPNNVQLIPVHTIPLGRDSLMVGQKLCPRYRENLSRLNASHEWAVLFQKLADVPSVGGLQPSTLANMTAFVDLCVCYNQHLPDRLREFGLTQENCTNIIDVATQAWSDAYDPNGAGAISGGALLSEIFARMKDAVDGAPSPRLLIYSGHDTTIANLLSALGMKLRALPPYGAQIVFELWKTGESYDVAVKYEGEAQTMCSGKAKCAYPELKKLLEKNIFDSWDLIESTASAWEMACTPSSSSSSQWSGVDLAVLSIMGVIVVGSLVGGVIFWFKRRAIRRKKYRKKDGMTFQRLDETSMQMESPMISMDMQGGAGAVSQAEADT